MAFLGDVSVNFLDIFRVYVRGIVLDDFFFCNNLLPVTKYGRLPFFSRDICPPFFIETVKDRDMKLLQK